MDGGSNFWAKYLPDIKIVFRYTSDEEFYVETSDGRQIAYANHDEDGWAGMTKIKDAVINFAHIVGLEVIEKGEPNV